MRLGKLLVVLGALAFGCAPTTNIGWRKKVANRIKYVDVEDVEIVRVKRYNRPEDRRDLLNSAEGIGATSPYGIGLDQNFSRNGTKPGYMVWYRYGNMTSTRFMRFDQFGNAIDKKQRW